jgi:hypothetical protein
MAVIDPEELYSEMDMGPKSKSFDRSLQQYMQDPDNYEDVN